MSKRKRRTMIVGGIGLGLLLFVGTNVILAARRGVKRADFARVFTGAGRRIDIFSWLFPHVNSTGYYYWFTAFQPEVDKVLELHGRS